MRALSPGTKIFMVIAAAVGVVVSLGMPWYGPAGGSSRAVFVNKLTGDKTLTGPDTSFFEGVSRWATADGTNGWDTLQTLDTVLLGLAILVAVLALATLIPAFEATTRSMLQTIALAIMVIAIVKLVDQPGDDTLVEPRRGAWLVLIFGAIMMSSAAGIAHARLRRATPATMSTLHDPTLKRGSVAPPGR